MASEIHKKRTGKGFNITEEIVQKEEMYEEDQDDFPRRYSAFALLGDQLRTSSSSSGTNNFTNPYSTYEAAIAILTRQQEIDRLFAEHFPNAAQIAQSQSLHAPNSQHIPQLPNHPCGPEQTQPAPDSALFSKLSSYPDSTSYHSFSSTSTFTTDEPISPRGPPTSGSASISRPGATPTSSCSDDSDDRAAKRRRASVISVDPSLTMSATLTSTNSVDSSSRLTLELPSERKLIGEDIENNQIVPVPHHKGELAAGLSCFSTEAQQCFSATSSDRLPLTTYNQQPVPTQQEEPTSFLSSSDPTFEFPNMQAYNGNPGWYSPPLGCGSGAPNHGDVNWDQWLTDHENLSLQIPVDSRSHATQRQN